MRKEINLSAYTIAKLKRLANIDNRSLKAYMETVLISHAEKNHKEKNPQISILDK